MEMYSLIFLTAGAAVASILLAAIAVAIRPLRRFTLAALALPAISLPLALIIRWSVLDSGAVCGPNPEWDRCPTATASLFGWVVWIAGTIAIGIGAYWAQRGIQAAIHLWFDSEPMR